MARVELVVELDREEPSYRPGEQIRGIVRVRSALGARCRHLRVAVAWSTTRCRADGALSAARSLFEGEWKPGSETSYRFELPAPAGPFSYQGELFSIEWTVRADAELAWTEDCLAFREISLHAWQSDELVPHTGGYRTQPMLAPKRYVFGSLAAEPKPPQLLAPSAVPFSGAVDWLGRSLRNAWARARLGGRPAIRMASPPRLGERLELVITASPGCRPFERVEARLSAQEVARPRARIFDDPSDSPTETSLAHFDSIDATSDGEAWRVQFEIPRTAPPTFNSRNAEVRWNLELACTAAGGPTWRTGLPLIVAPAGCC